MNSIGRLPAFFQDDDDRRDLDLLAAECRRYEVAVWGYGPMPNHAHVVAVPSTVEGLADAIGETQLRRHARTGRPLGSEAFLRQVKAQTGLLLSPQKRGPKTKQCQEEGDE